MNKTIQIYHDRSKKRFEAWCKKNGIKFQFEGYCCGMYDPQYKVPLTADFKTCPIDVWLSNKNGSTIKLN